MFFSSPFSCPSRFLLGCRPPSPASWSRRTPSWPGTSCPSLQRREWDTKQQQQQQQLITNKREEVHFAIKIMLLTSGCTRVIEVREAGKNIFSVPRQLKWGLGDEHEYEQTPSSSSTQLKKLLHYISNHFNDFMGNNTMLSLIHI